MVLHIIHADILLIARIFPSPQYYATRKISKRIICKTIEKYIFLNLIKFWLPPPPPPLRFLNTTRVLVVS